MLAVYLPPIAQLRGSQIRFSVQQELFVLRMDCLILLYALRVCIRPRQLARVLVAQRGCINRLVCPARVLIAQLAVIAQLSDLFLAQILLRAAFAPQQGYRASQDSVPRAHFH